MLRIWGRRNSFNVQKVMWLVGELGLVHEHIPAGGNFGGLDTPQFLAMNPHGRVPVIDDGGAVIWESHTILRYLAARYGAGRFWAEDPAARAEAECWMDWLQTVLQPAFLNDIFWGFYRTPPQRRDGATIQRGIDKCTAHFQLLDRWLEGRAYMLGDQLSLADITVGTTLYRYYGLDIPRPRVPNVEAWYASLQERAPYREHVMVSFADLEGRLGN
ncbi:glutathione S-transferase [Labrys miyagiensis]|uniref:Glutathione S-transferase n=1 Tax=Labrys miyagiensis TaxID=346912 RepID=A0ABQ6CQF8_9HYPH|nr:glutathione S-transferase [Labrys miyagiensis]GLS22591.1 glutathione S-transferase [Labrys miyagiensis]